MADLFAGVLVSDYAAAKPWYERLFGAPPSFVAHETECVWELGEHGFVLVGEDRARAGRSALTIFVDDLDAMVEAINARGIDPAQRETYSNGVRKATYRDADGNEIGFGGAPAGASDRRGRGVELLREVLRSFNEHDLDAIMSRFAEDCVFEAPRGPERWGRRFVGKDEVRRGLAARFEGIPDVHYRDDDHFACGNRGVSEWTISGTTIDGVRVDVRGCDIWTLGDDDRIVRKDSYWKIREESS